MRPLGPALLAISMLLGSCGYRGLNPNAGGTPPPSQRGVSMTQQRPEQTPLPEPKRTPPGEIPDIGTEIELSDEEWRERLTPEQFHILRERGTERAWTGAYLKNEREGTYHCAACNNPLFSSDAKFDSRTGWPSFYAPMHTERIEVRMDRRHNMQRKELLCAVCGGHLGHVFDDGPEPTGLRYCVNSAALYFRPANR